VQDNRTKSRQSRYTGDVAGAFDGDEAGILGLARLHGPRRLPVGSPPGLPCSRLLRRPFRLTGCSCWLFPRGPSFMFELWRTRRSCNHDRVKLVLSGFVDC
jgi:hypothetical protein